MKQQSPQIRFLKTALRVLIVLVFVYIAVAMVTTSYDFGYRMFTEPAMEASPGEDVLVQIKDGMSARKIGQMLKEKNLVRNANLFALQLTLSAYSDELKPGVYTLNTSMTPKEMIALIAEESKAGAVIETETEEEALPEEEGEAEGSAPVEEAQDE